MMQMFSNSVNSGVSRHDVFDILFERICAASRRQVCDICFVEKWHGTGLWSLQRISGDRLVRVRASERESSGEQGMRGWLGGTRQDERLCQFPGRRRVFIALDEARGRAKTTDDPGAEETLARAKYPEYRRDDCG